MTKFKFSWVSCLIGAVSLFVLVCLPKVGDIILKPIYLVRTKVFKQAQ